MLTTASPRFDDAARVVMLIEVTCSNKYLHTTHAADPAHRVFDDFDVPTRKKTAVSPIPRQSLKERACIQNLRLCIRVWDIHCKHPPLRHRYWTIMIARMIFCTSKFSCTAVQHSLRSSAAVIGTVTLSLPSTGKSSNRVHRHPCRQCNRGNECYQIGHWQ